MIDCIRVTERKARKEYICNGFRDVFRSLSYNDLLEIVDLPSEKVFVITMKQKGYKIQKGEVYLEQTYAGDGECYTIKISKQMEEIMNKYNLYGDD